MKKLISILTFIMLGSCMKNNDENGKEYFSSSNIKSLKEYNNKNILIKNIEYYDTIGKLPFKIIYKKDNYDSIVFFYKNKNIYKKGLEDFKQRKFGNWYRYTKEGYLSEIREYFIIENNFLLSSINEVFLLEDIYWFVILF